jgi:hypothetical protein
MPDAAGCQDSSISARDVRPGMVVWNPYGGARGRALVASDPRERPDGAIEFDTADGRTGVYRPRFRLHFDRAATERLATGQDAERQSGQERLPETGTERIEVRAAGDGAKAQAVTTGGRVTGLGAPGTGKSAVRASQAVADGRAADYDLEREA